MKRIAPIYILILFMGFVFMSMNAYAQEQAKKEPFYVPYDQMTQVTLLRPASSNETIGMAFYKMASIQPDFVPWSPKTARSMRVPEYDRDIVALQELSRLQNEYENLRTEDPLIIRTRVDMTDFSARQETLFLKEIGPRTLFKYDIYGLPVVLLAKGLGRFSRIKVPPKEADFILNELQGRDDAILQVLVIPERAEPDRAVELNDGTFYPMVVKIAEFSLWTNDKDARQMWVYKAPWYDDKKRQRDLLNLYVQ